MKTYSYQSIFNYGEVGDSLNGFRNSEISSQSAKSLYNFYISEMGTLKVAKQYKKIELLVGAKSGEYIINRLNTKYNFFIIITQSRIISINKISKAKISEIDVSSGDYVLDEKCNINIFNDFIFIKDKNRNTYVFAFNKDGNLGTTNFFDTIELPFQQKQDVGFDVYQCFSIDGKIRPELMTTVLKDEALTIDENGQVFLTNSGLKIDRLYEQYKSSITTDQISGATAGLTFIVFKGFQKSEGELSYHLGNTKISFTDRTKDESYGSYYYTKASPKSNGKLIYGILEDFVKNKKGIIDVVEFQSRLVISTSEKIYFSKILDYNNFIPSLEADAGFFIKPSVIDGNQPNIKKLIVGNGLYIVCEEGVIVAGYGSTINGVNMSNIHIASNSKPSHLTTLIEDTFYYVDTNGLLRAIIPNFDGGIVRFANVIVEKYAYKKDDIKYISRGNINEDNVLIVTPITEHKIMKIYTTVEAGIFRKFSLGFDNSYPILGFNNDMVNGISYYELTNKNVPLARVVLNVPFLNNSKGVFLNDFTTTYRRVITNIFTNNKQESIEGVLINKKPIQNLGYEAKGDYNIYDYLGTLPIIDLTLQIKTKETSDVIELRGINGVIELSE